MHRMAERLVNVATVGMLVVAGYGVLQPGSPVRSRVAAAWNSVTAPHRIGAVWSDLTRDGARLGADSGVSLIVEFSDYQCPFCKRNQPIIESFVGTYSGVTIVYRHLPLAGHHAAAGAARASICAEKSGAFTALHNHIFSSTQWIADTNWLAAARAAGIRDLAAFTDCLGSAETRQRLEADISLAKTLGIRATPTFVARRRIAVGLQSESQLAELAGVAP